jgi:lipoyl synthase
LDTRIRKAERPAMPPETTVRPHLGRGRAKTAPQKLPPSTGILPRKPPWIRVQAPTDPKVLALKALLREKRLHTVCEEAACPNLGECFSHGTATFMILGDLCTRRCPFCDVAHGRPAPPDSQEPRHLAEAVAGMGLSYAVITSVDRDDLPDGGAAHLAACVRAIKEANPKTAVEALTPDFQGVLADVETVVDSGIEVFAQNVETVERLTHPVRDPRAGYRQTLDVLEHSKRHRPAVLTKTSLMLGLGETTDELLRTMDDLRAIGCDLLTLGQYLRPTANHLPVERYVTPDQFLELRSAALQRGFRECVSGPMVRSSYRAERALAGNNCGIQA